MAAVTTVKAKPMSISFYPDVFQKITEYCTERGCTRSWFMNKAAEVFLNECLEDKDDYETAASAWADFEKSGKKTHSADEVFSKAGL